MQLVSFGRCLLSFGAVVVSFSHTALADYFSVPAGTRTLQERSLNASYRYASIKSGTIFPKQTRSLQELGLQIHFPVGEAANWEINYVAQRVIDKAHGSGDASFFASYLPFQWPDFWVGARIGIKLPNANHLSGLGTNESDGYFLVSTRNRPAVQPGAKGWLWRGDVGLGILGNPGVNSAQYDVLVVDADAGWTASRWSVLGGGHFQSLGKNFPPFGTARVTVGYHQQPWSAYLIPEIGFNRQSPQWALNARLNTAW